VGEPISAFRYVGEELKHSRWYKQTHEPHEHGDSALVLLARSVSYFSNVSVHRKISQPMFDDDELSVLRVLAPHLSRAVMIADLLDTRALQSDMLAAALDRLAVGIVLTDAVGAIVHANQAAEVHLEDGTADDPHSEVGHRGVAEEQRRPRSGGVGATARQRLAPRAWRRLCGSRCRIHTRARRYGAVSC
jgi:hypothetical protein